MAETFKHLAQGKVVHQGDATAQTLHTSPSGTTTMVGHIRIVNNHSAAVTFTLSHGGLSTADNAFIMDKEQCVGLAGGRVIYILGQKLDAY